MPNEQFYIQGLPDEAFPGLKHLLGPDVKSRGSIVVLTPNGLHRLKRLPGFTDYVVATGLMGLDMWVNARAYHIEPDARVGKTQAFALLGRNPTLPPDGAIKRHNNKDALWWWRSSLLTERVQVKSSE